MQRHRWIQRRQFVFVAFGRGVVLHHAPHWWERIWLRFSLLLRRGADPRQLTHSSDRPGRNPRTATTAQARRTGCRAARPTRPWPVPSHCPSHSRRTRRLCGAEPEPEPALGLTGTGDRTVTPGSPPRHRRRPGGLARRAGRRSAPTDPDPGPDGGLPQLVVDQIGDVGDGGAGRDGRGLLVDRAVVPEAHLDQPGELPDRGAQRIQRGVIEHRHGEHGQLGEGGRERQRRIAVDLVRTGDRDDRRVLDLRAGHLVITVRSSAGSVPARAQYTIASAVRRTPSRARPPPRSSAAPSISPGISTSWTRTPPMRVRAGTGRRVVNAKSPVRIWMSESAWSTDDLPTFGGPTSAIWAAPSRQPRSSRGGPRWSGPGCPRSRPGAPCEVSYGPCGSREALPAAPGPRGSVRVLLPDEPPLGDLCECAMRHRHDRGLLSAAGEATRTAHRRPAVVVARVCARPFP